MSTLAQPPLILTDDQFEDMTRKGAFTKVGRVELRRGMITPKSPVCLRHSTCVGATVTALQQAVRASGLPLRVNPVVTIRFGGGFQPTADVVLWEPSGLDPDGPIPGAAVRLVVEAADASLADDLGPKVEEYACAGLPEYWVADVKARTLYLHDGPAEAGYRRRSPVAFGAEAAALTLPLTVGTEGL
jgi:Uma2 family endonuclease